MTQIVFGLFKDSKSAGETVSQLKKKGYTKEISVLARNDKSKNGIVHEVKNDTTDGAQMGAVAGAITGALAAMFSGITSVFVPGIGLLVGGPLIALLGVTGGVIGSLSGGLIGALVDLGVSEASAEIYEAQINKGQVLVGVTSNEEKIKDVQSILKNGGATEMTVTDSASDAPVI